MLTSGCFGWWEKRDQTRFTPKKQCKYEGYHLIPIQYDY